MKKKIIISVAILVVLLVMAGGYYYAHYYSGYMRITANHTQLSSNGKSLFWFDVKHSNDINDVMFEDIEMEITRFSPDLILVEGSADKDKSDTRDAAILNGESAFANYLGRQASVIVEDIEPPFSKQIEYLLQVKYANMKLITRSKTVDALRGTKDIFRIAASLLDAVEKRPVRLVGIGLSGFTDTEYKQMTLDDMEDQRADDRKAALDGAMLDLQRKFGGSVLKTGDEMVAEKRFE